MSEENHCILAFPNRIDDTVTNATEFIAGVGSWLTALPLENLKDEKLAKVARSTDCTNASTQFAIDLGRSFRVQVLALLRHNISLAGRIKYTAYLDVALTQEVYSSGWQFAWPVVYPAELLDWEDDNFWNATWAADVAASYPIFSLQVLNPRITARYWKIEVDDETNPDGYIEIGRATIATGWQPKHNMNYGNGIVWERVGLTDTTLGGVEHIEDLYERRRQTLTFDGLDYDEAMALIFDMQKILGRGGQVFFVADPNDTIHMLRRAFLATIPETKAIKQLPCFFTNSIELVEVI